MKSSRAAALTLLALAGAAALAPARAADPPPFRLEDRLPVSTLGLVAVEGFPAGWGAALATTPLGALLARPDVEAEVRPLLELLRRGFGRVGAGEAMLAHVAPALADLDGRLALALVGLASDGTPGIVVSLDFGANLSRFAAFLSEARRDLPSGWTAREVEGGAPHERAFGLSDGAATWLVRLVGTTVVATNQGDVVAASSASARATPALAELPAFADGFASPAHRESASIRAYVNVAALVTRALDDPGGSFGSRFATAAGLRALTTLRYRASVEGGAVVEALTLGATRAEAGVFSLLRTAPLADERPLPEPRRTWLRLETSLPVSTWPARWRTFLHDVDPDDEAEFVDGLARLAHVMGADLEAEVLPHLVDEQTLSFGLADAGGAFPDVVLSIPLRRPPGLSSLEPILVRAVEGWCSDRTQRGDETVRQRTHRAGERAFHVIEFRSPGGGDATPLSPTWAIVDSRLVVTPVPHTMRALLRRLEPGRAAPPAADAGRAAGRAAARASGTALVVATKDLLTSVYDTLVPLAEAVPSWKRAAAAAGFDPARLPSAEETSAAWSETVISLRVGADGVVMGATSPLGVLPLVGLVVASLKAAAAPGEPTDEASEPGGLEPAASVSPPRDDPGRLTANALERIARALEEYVRLRGAFPTALEELATKEPLLAFVPRDAWGRPLRYARPSSGAPARVASAGPDGVFDSEDDVAVDVETPAK